MKRIVYQLIIGVTAIMVLFSSCRNNEQVIVPESGGVPEGYVNISFRVNQSDMNTVDVRAVDPDGQDIHSMSLFCFNAYGLFLAVIDEEKVTLELNKNVGSGEHITSGTYKADIPEETAIIHFIANLNPNLYRNKDFFNKTEAQVLGAMEGGSGMMVYWRRFARENNGTDIKSQLTNLSGGIKLIRNQAKVTVQLGEEYTGFNITGFVATNIHAFGTVAPFCSTHGFAIYEWPVSDNHYSVTLPVNTSMMSDITDVNTKSEDYIFEHENTLDNPVSVIIKGHDNLYYRAMIMDDEGNMLPILRNHHYVIKINGPLSYGQDTFEKAINAPATNNVWVSIDSWVKEVADNEYKLTVAETSKVFNEDKAGTAYSFEYTLTNADETMTGVTAPEVSWLDGNNVGKQKFVHVFDASTGKGHISVTLEEDNPELLEQTGTLLISKGRLYRTIDISMISTQTFTPSWIAAQVYGENVGENVTLKFTIPETCPESLFPFPVMITVNDLDVRAASGMKLPVRLESEASWYGEPNEVGYKYEYIVDKPGVHRLYFHTLQTHTDTETESVILEANFFRKLEKEVTFANHQRAITVDGLLVYNENGTGDTFADDELVQYVLAPQKINAPVWFCMKMQDLQTNTPINAGSDDEFLLYSKTLDYGKVGEEEIFGIQAYDCNFHDVDESYWSTSTNGRVMMFKPKNPNKTETDKGHYHIYMKTNRPKSVDVIRISSNRSGQKSAILNNGDYMGLSYRSTIFELSNYRPFRFAARIGETGNVMSSSDTDAEETVDEIKWDYAAPGKKVDISFDVTSFQSVTDQNSVNPFGTEFEIYIDAPMLEIDVERLSECNLNAEKLKVVGGRFVYTVDADRGNEKRYGISSAVNKDNTNGIDQENERKKLPFKTKKITNAGEIKISSNKDKVVFYDKIFKVKNNLIQGSISYKASETAEPVAIPANSFVAFVRTLTGARIGSITINTTGQYELNLRSEYTFNWTDQIELNSKIGGVAYEYKCYTDGEETKNLTLDYLSSHPDVILVPATSTQYE